MGGKTGARVNKGLPKCAKAAAATCGYLRTAGGRKAVGAAIEGGRAAVDAVREIGPAMNAAGWRFPSESTFYKARAIMAGGGWPAGSPEAAVEAAVALALAGPSGWPKTRERAIVAAAARMWARAEVPSADSLPPAFHDREEGRGGVEGESETGANPDGMEEAEPGCVREAAPDARGTAAQRFEAAMALVEGGEHARLATLLKREIGNGALARLLRRAAELSASRTPEGATCRVCLALLTAGAPPDRADREGRMPWELASGRTAAILAAANDFHGAKTK